eukprot:UN25643
MEHDSGAEEADLDLLDKDVSSAALLELFPGVKIRTREQPDGLVLPAPTVAVILDSECVQLLRFVKFAELLAGGECATISPESVYLSIVGITYQRQILIARVGSGDTFDSFSSWNQQRSASDSIRLHL